MCDQTEIPYKHGDVVWVKFGKCFWPGQVVGIDKLPEDVADCLKKDPIAVVQFFDEDQYEFVKNLDQISLYNGRRKLEFIKKGLDMYQNQKGKSTFMNKFPEDVKKAELLTGGNPNILNDPILTPKEKSSYQGLFDGNKTSPKKEKAMAAAKKRATLSPKTNGRKSMTPVAPIRTPRPITHPRFVKGETDHDVRIRDQAAAKITSPTETDGGSKPKSDAAYKCQFCDFTSNRLNVIVAHSKFHSGDADNQGKGKSASGKGKAGTPKSRTSLSTPVTKVRANAKTKTKAVADESKIFTQVSSPVPSSSKLVTSPKSATKRKIIDNEDLPKGEDTGSPTKAKVKAKESPVKKSPEKAVDNKSKMTAAGKRKLLLATEKSVKKSKNDEEIRDQLLADWDEEDAEQEKKELEELKKKKLSEERLTKEASCFDFDDSKDSILDTELEERAKKFVESRKTPREKVENNKDLSHSVVLSDVEPVADKEANGPCPEDFAKVIDSLLEETVVPELPQIPSGLLPDVVLDSSIATTTESKTDPPSTGEHDYSARNEDVATVDDIDTLDINSMPVVMTDDIVTEEPSTSHAPFVEVSKIDLVPSAGSASTPAIVFSQEEIKMPTSVKSLVKAVRTTVADQSKITSKATVSQANARPTMTVTRKLAPMSGAVSKGIAAGKYIIVQSPSGQNSRLQLATTANTSQQLPGKVTVLSKPMQKLTPNVAAGQQKLLTTLSPGQKLLNFTPQQKVTTLSPGQQKILTVTPKQKFVSTTFSGQQKVLTVSPGQQKVLTVAPGQQKVLTVAPGQQKVLTVTPKQPKVLTVTPAQHKLLTGSPGQPQLLMTASGQILTQVTHKGALPAGSKFTPVRTLTPGRQSVGPRLTMQSLQTKVCLPNLRPVGPVTAQQKRVIGGMGAQTGTVVIQTAPRAATATAAASARPRLLKTQAAPAGVPMTIARPATLRPKILQSRSTLQPRMVVQKTSTTTGIVSGMQQVSGLVTQPQVIQKIIQPNPGARFVPQPRKAVPPPAKRAVAAGQPRPVMTIPQQATQYVPQPIQKAPVAMPVSNVDMMSLQELPPLAPIQSSSALSSGNITLTIPQASGLSLPGFQTCSVATTGNTGLTSEQLAQVMASPQVSQMGDAGGAGSYVFLTIDEAGNLQYNNNNLISYDGSDGTGQTLYIDSSSLESGGDLDNMILTIDNSGVGGELNLGEGGSSWMPSASQDILAAALANTDVFQPEVSLHDTCVVDTSSLLSSIPSTLLLPPLNRNVTTAANVSETSLTLNQPIMSPLEVTSSVTSFRAPPSVCSNVGSLTSVYAEPTLSRLVSAEPVAYHPSMPLLSEEATHFVQAAGEVSLSGDLSLPCGMTGEIPFTTESYHVGDGTSSGVGGVSYLQDTSSADSQGSVVGPDAAVDIALTENPEAVPSKTDLSHSMPLLCDDPVDSSGGQGVTGDNLDLNGMTEDAMEVLTDKQCEVVTGDDSSNVELMTGDDSVCVETVPGKIAEAVEIELDDSSSFVETVAGDSSGFVEMVPGNNSDFVESVPGDGAGFVEIESGDNLGT